MLHNLVALPLVLFLVIASFLLAFSGRRVDRLRHLWLPALASAVATAVFFVWFGSSSFGSYGGLVQRGLVLFAYGLPLLVSWAATRPASRRRAWSARCCAQKCCV